MIKDSGFRLRTVALVACCGALLVGCGGGSSTVSEKKEMPDNPPGASTPATETKESRQTTQRTAITRASTTATAAVAEVGNDATDAEVTAADNAITALNTAIGNAEDLPPTELAAFRVTRDALTASLNKAKTSRTAAQTAATTAQTTESRRTTQRTAITRASTTATAAVVEVGNDATDAEVTAADNAITALNTAIGNAEDLPPTELAAFRVTRDALTASLNKAKTDRTAAQTAQTEAQTQRDMAAARTDAAKLFREIFPHDASGVRAEYNSDNNRLDLTYIPEHDTPTILSDSAVILTEDTMASINPNNGWKGKKYTHKDDEGNIIAEAYVYADLVSAQGLKFGKEGDDDDYAYELDNNGFLAESGIDFTDSTTSGAALVAIPGINKPRHTFSGTLEITRRGSFHGVSGQYTCTPTDGNPCVADVYDSKGGFILSGGSPTWKFKPLPDGEQRLTSPPDNNYASYGHWIYQPAGDDWTASAFYAYRGAPTQSTPAVTALTSLRGEANYRGGATGWYALSSSTGGTNDSGNFTASVTLKADFGTSSDPATITGTISDFKGADGNSRPWKVDLLTATATTAGAISGGKADWSINGNKESPGCDPCNWGGQFYDVDSTDSRPLVVTGSFYTQYSVEGKMVGSFGTKKQ